MKKRIFEYETTQFDYDFINHIKSIRIHKKISQDNLSILMGLAKSFVGNVESHTQVHKYSTRHITLLAKVFEYKNIGELLSFSTPKYDRIKITVEQTYNETGTKVIKNKVIKITEID